MHDDTHVILVDDDDNPLLTPDGLVCQFTGLLEARYFAQTHPVGFGMTPIYTTEAYEFTDSPVI